MLPLCCSYSLLKTQYAARNFFEQRSLPPSQRGHCHPPCHSCWRQQQQRQDKSVSSFPLQTLAAHQEFFCHWHSTRAEDDCSSDEEELDCASVEGDVLGRLLTKGKFNFVKTDTKFSCPSMSLQCCTDSDGRLFRCA